VSLAVLKVEHDRLRTDHDKLAEHVEKIDAQQELIGRQQAWVFGLGTGMGGAGMLLVQLVLQKVF